MSEFNTRAEAEARLNELQDELDNAVTESQINHINKKIITFGSLAKLKDAGFFGSNPTTNAETDVDLNALGLKEVKVIFNGEFENVDFWAAQYKKLIDVNESNLTISWGYYSGNGCIIEVDGGDYIGPVVEDIPNLSYNEFAYGVQLSNLQKWAGPIQITVTPSTPK